LIKKAEMMHHKDNIVELDSLIAESEELKRVLSAIINKAKEKK
jgi:hypothetical protein